MSDNSPINQALDSYESLDYNISQIQEDKKFIDYIELDEIDNISIIQCLAYLGTEIMDGNNNIINTSENKIYELRQILNHIISVSQRDLHHKNINLEESLTRFWPKVSKIHNDLMEIDKSKISPVCLKIISKGARKGNPCNAKSQINTNLCYKHKFLEQNIIKKSCIKILTQGPRKDTFCGARANEDSYCRNHLNILNPKKVQKIIYPYCISTYKTGNRVGQSCENLAKKGECCGLHSRNSKEKNINVRSEIPENVIKTQKEYNSINLETGWTNSEIARMKNLHIYKRILLSNGEYDMKTSINNARVFLLERYENVNIEIKRAIVKADVAIHELNKAKLQDIIISENDIINNLAPQTYERRVGMINVCRIEKQDLIQAVKSRKHKLEGLPMHNELYVIPNS